MSRRPASTPTHGRSCGGRFANLADKGTAVVLTTQYLEEADRLSDSIVIIDEGVMKASGTSADLKRDLERDVLEVHVASREELPRPRSRLPEPGHSRLQIPKVRGSRSRSPAALVRASRFSGHSMRTESELPTSS